MQRYGYLNKYNCLMKYYLFILYVSLKRSALSVCSGTNGRYKEFISAGHRAFENAISFELSFWAKVAKDITNGHGTNVNNTTFGWNKVKHNFHFKA